MMTSCASGRCTTPRIARLVVCGRLLVIATLVPTRAFMSVDLPTFGRPAKQANPDLNWLDGRGDGVPTSRFCRTPSRWRARTTLTGRARWRRPRRTAEGEANQGETDQDQSRDRCRAEPLAQDDQSQQRCDGRFREADCDRHRGGHSP
jgi:hypothetical protein